MSPALGPLHRLVADCIEAVAPDAELAEVAPDTDLADAVDLDSMDLLNIAAALFERTGVDIPERTYTGFATLDDYVRHLEAAGYRHG